MSKIQAKPYIEKIVATLSEEQKTSLLSLINGSNQTPAFRSLVNANNLITGADKGVSHIVLETWNKTYTGYLLYNDTYCVLVAYSNNTQELNIVKINLANRTYNLVKEVLTILEFRYIVGGTSGIGVDVTIDEINSGSTTAGKVIVADGEGGAEWGTAGMENPMTTAGDIIVGGTDGTPARLGVGTEGQVLKVGSSGLEWGSAGGGSTPDADVTVEIESNYSSTDYANRTNYATAISLQEWIANCEAGNVYTNAGIIAKVNNLISGKAFRLILIGTNHEVLAYDDTTQAKTTWQFLDMPEHNVRLGLPINVLDMGGTDSRAQLNAFLDGTNESSITVYPSNMDGLISAQGLLQVNETIYDELPETLQRHIKIVRRYYYRKRNTMSIGASTEGNPGAISNSGQMCQLAQGIFHLAGTDLGTSGQSGEGSDSKYNYFVGNANRVRYYNGTASSWWNASPNTSNSNYWYYIGTNGTTSSNGTGSDSGVAPAFCI